MSENSNTERDFDKNGGYEKRDVKINKIIIVTVVLTVFLIFSLVMLNELFISVKENVVYEAFLKPPSQILLESRKEQDAILNSYGVVDEEKGVYRIPISKAMDLYVEESNK